MYARDAVHPGLAVMPADVGRERQQELVPVLIDWIADAAARTQQSPADFMVNRLVRIDEAATCVAEDLP